MNKKVEKLKKNTGRKKNSYYKRKKTTKPNVVSKKSNELKKTIPEKKVDIKKEKEKQTVKKETEEIKFYSFEEVKQEDNLDQAVFLNDANDSQENETNPSKDLEDTSTLEDELNSSINNYSDEKNNDDFTFLNEVKKQQQDNINTQSENTVSYNKSKYKFYLSYEQRLILNLVAIIMLFVLALTIFLSSITIRSRSSMAYNQSSNLNYNVSLKENDYYNDENLNQNMQYIASLIDYIDVDFNYNFNASNTFDYTYTYYIESYVSVTDGEDDSKVIYSKIDKLTDPVTVANDNSSGFNINQNVRINYDEYNDLVKEFKSTYGLSADSNLVLSLRLEIKDKTGTVIRSLDT